MTRRVGEASIKLSVELSAAEVRERLVLLYGFGDIEVIEQRQAGNVTYIISFVDEQGGIDFEQIEWGDEIGDNG